MPRVLDKTVHESKVSPERLAFVWEPQSLAIPVFRIPYEGMRTLPSRTGERGEMPVMCTEATDDTARVSKSSRKTRSPTEKLLATTRHEPCKILKKAHSFFKATES